MLMAPPGDAGHKPITVNLRHSDVVVTDQP
jgi:hypothetical protein